MVEVIWTCVVKLEPQESGTGLVVNAIVVEQFQKILSVSVKEQMENGVIGGFPVVDVKVTLFDGSYHDVDSSEVAFKVATTGIQRRCKKSKTSNFRTSDVG